MTCILGELHDVPQRDPQVLQQFPCGMGKAWRHFAAQVAGEVVDYSMKIGVGLTPVQHFGQLLSDLLILRHAFSCSGGVMVAGVPPGATRPTTILRREILDCWECWHSQGDSPGLQASKIKLFGEDGERVTVARLRVMRVFDFHASNW